jgi:hypothetical protein
MRIHSDFIGGNITVVKQNGSDIYLENQIRDSDEDWFYWDNEDCFIPLERENIVPME